MHECPECGQACDCDGEDTWNDIGSSDWLNCSHECEEYSEEDDLMPDDFEEPVESDLFCSEHQCAKNLVDYSDDSRYECPECEREREEALGLR